MTNEQIMDYMKIGWQLENHKVFYSLRSTSLLNVGFYAMYKQYVR